MDDLTEDPPKRVPPPESVFRREEAELRKWLDENVTDLSMRRWYLAQQRNDHVMRGRRVD